MVYNVDYPPSPPLGGIISSWWGRKSSGEEGKGKGKGKGDWKREGKREGKRKDKRKGKWKGKKGKGKCKEREDLIFFPGKRGRLDFLPSRKGMGRGIENGGRLDFLPCQFEACFFSNTLNLKVYLKFRKKGSENVPILFRIKKISARGKLCKSSTHN